MKYNLQYTSLFLENISGLFKCVFMKKVTPHYFFVYVQSVKYYMCNRAKITRTWPKLTPGLKLAEKSARAIFDDHGFESTRFLVI